MRPRTATIQVSKEEDIWHVEIGNPKHSTSDISTKHNDLGIALMYAVLKWKQKEGLDV